MTNYFENKLSMLQKVLAYLLLKALQTNNVPSVALLQALLSSNIDEIIRLASIADADGTGYTRDKDIRRDALEATTFKVGAAVAAYAIMNDMNALLEKNDETVPSQAVMRDNDIYIYSTTVSASAAAVIAATYVDGGNPIGILSAYNITSDDITALGTAQTAYLPYIQEPRLQINERATAREDMVRTFMENDKKVITKLDKLMRIFISTNLSLYNGYKGVRNIDDDGNAMATPDYAGTAEAGVLMLIAELPYNAGRTFTFRNDGAADLLFALSTTADSVDGTPVTVASGGSSQRVSTNLNEADTANFLLVQNDGGNGSDYRVWVSE